MSALARSHALDDSQGDAADGAYKVNSLSFTADVDPLAGDVRWDPARSLWNAGMLLAALVLGPLYFTWRAVTVCVVLMIGLARM